MENLEAATHILLGGEMFSGVKVSRARRPRQAGGEGKVKGKEVAEEVGFEREAAKFFLGRSRDATRIRGGGYVIRY